jgi:hypothetical protein
MRARRSGVHGAGCGCNPVRVVAAAQGEPLAAVGHRLQGTRVHTEDPRRQLVGLGEAQALQQTRLLHPTRVGTVDPGHVAPDGGGLAVRQRANRLAL